MSEYVDPTRAAGRFRLLFLGRSGAVVHTYEFRAHDDAEALRVAEGMRGLSAMELWTGERNVKRWDTFPPDPPNA